MKKIKQIATINVGYLGLIALTEDGQLFELRGKTPESPDFFWKKMPDIVDEIEAETVEE